MYQLKCLVSLTVDMHLQSSKTDNQMLKKINFPIILYIAYSHQEDFEKCVYTMMWPVIVVQ